MLKTIKQNMHECSDGCLEDLKKVCWNSKREIHTKQRHIKSLFGLQPWSARPILRRWLMVCAPVWIEAKVSQPRQIFGHKVQFFRQRWARVRAAKTCANLLARPALVGRGQAPSKQALILYGVHSHVRLSKILPKMCYSMLISLESLFCLIGGPF
jgi:hypothetical protein